MSQVDMFAESASLDMDSAEDRAESANCDGGRAEKLKTAECNNAMEVVPAVKRENLSDDRYGLGAGYPAGERGVSQLFSLDLESARRLAA